MKKYIATVPLAPIGEGRGKAERTRYGTVGNSKLKYEKETVFPVMYLLGGYVQEGEKAEVIALCTDLDAPKGNLEALKNEVREFSKEINADISVRELMVENSEAPSKHLDVFGKLIDMFENGDELAACITYGTKPTPLVIMMSINFAYRTLKDCRVESIIYGARDHNSPNKESCVYDVSNLFHMDEIVRQVANANVCDPKEYVMNILNWGNNYGE